MVWSAFHHRILTIWIILTSNTHNIIKYFIGTNSLSIHCSTVTSEAGDLNQTAQTTQNENAAFNLTIYDVNPDDVYNTNDIISQIKAAFIYHLKKNDAKCFEILNDLLEDPNSYAATELDSIINKIAADLAEDIPAADPRWEEQIAQSKYALGSSASMQIIQQLKEKQRAFIHFVEFLHTSGLWDRVSSLLHFLDVQ